MADLRFKLHTGQKQVWKSRKRFNILCLGRRWGKTTLGKAIISKAALEGQYCAWFAPIYKDLLEVWDELISTLRPYITRANANERVIELASGGKIECWTLENKDASRGRHYHLIIVDEAAKCPHLQYVWENAIRGTLTDLEGDAWFLSTPRGKANYFYNLWLRGQDASGEWEEWASWQMPTSTNPLMQQRELDKIRKEVGPRVFAVEYEASFDSEIEGALFDWDCINRNRVTILPEMKRVVVAIDPAVSANTNSNLTGIVVCGLGFDGHGYVLQDATMKGSPSEWAAKAVGLYREWQADAIVAETNQGGAMVESTIRTVDRNISYKSVHSYRGKALRAEPISSLYSNDKVHHFGYDLNDLELQMTTWVPGEESPDRLDATIHGLTELMIVNKTNRVIGEIRA